VSYPVDKAIFVRHYLSKNSDEGAAEEAWRVYFIARRAELYADTVERASEVYDQEESKIPGYVPNPRRRALPGGHPHERALEIIAYTDRHGVLFAGVLLEDRRERQSIELTGEEMGTLYRMSSSSPLLERLLERAGIRRDAALGFSELEAVVVALADDPNGFDEMAAGDKGTESMDCMPQAAALARWGPLAERTAKRL
jgi:hypothetical protein